MKRIILLYLWHTLFCIVYGNYIMNNGGDSLEYFRRSQITGIPFDFGTTATVWLTSIPAYHFGASFLVTSIFFGFFGSIGLLAFDAALAHTVRYKVTHTKQIASFIAFLPSISFWSAGIGKDSVAFMAVGLVLWGMQNVSKRFIIITFGIGAMTLVRPHIGVFLMVALGASLIFSRTASMAIKISFAIVSFGASILILPIVLDKVGIEERLSIDKFDEILDKRQSYNLDGGSSIDISSMNLPEQMFTYVFRPLFFDAHSVASLIISIDNLVLLILCLTSLGGLIRKKQFIKSPNNLAFIVIFVLITWLALSMTTANLGIAVRQKWMFVPALLLLMFHFHGDSRRWMPMPLNFAAHRRTA